MDDAVEINLAEWCEANYPRLVGLLALYVRDRGVAEELAQETLLRVCQRWSEVRHMNSPHAWSVRVSLNIANSWGRRRAAERRAQARYGDTSPPESLPDHAAVLAVREAISRLPRRQRTALVLRYYEEFSVVETASIMQCAEGTVRALTHQAMQRLRQEPGITESLGALR
jgi:RNA polymerase sigma factor (sigma-70 family)